MKKVDFYNSVIVVFVKRCQNICIYVKKILDWVIFRKEPDKDSETGLKGGRRNTNLNYSAFPYTQLLTLSLFALYI